MDTAHPKSVASDPIHPTPLDHPLQVDQDSGKFVSSLYVGEPIVDIIETMGGVSFVVLHWSV